MSTINVCHYNMINKATPRFSNKYEFGSTAELLVWLNEIKIADDERLSISYNGVDIYAQSHETFHTQSWDREGLEQPEVLVYIRPQISAFGYANAKEFVDAIMPRIEELVEYDGARPWYEDVKAQLEASATTVDGVTTYAYKRVKFRTLPCGDLQYSYDEFKTWDFVKDLDVATRYCLANC